MTRIPHGVWKWQHRFMMKISKNVVLHIFDVIMSDNVKARIQMADGQYVHAVQDGELINAQKYFETMENR